MNTKILMFCVGSLALVLLGAYGYIAVYTVMNKSVPAHEDTRMLGEQGEVTDIKEETISSHTRTCVRGGCSGQLCVEEGEETMTTCEYRAEYACYATATCERQKDGMCGWTETSTLTECLLHNEVGTHPGVLEVQ